MKKIVRRLVTLLPFLWLANTAIASAHEAYVLDKDTFWGGLDQPVSARALTALKDSHNLHLTIGITLGIIALFSANLLFRFTRVGSAMNDFFERFSRLGPFFVRAAIAIALFFSAWSMSFLGPELSITQLPLASIMRGALFAISIMIAIGLFTEVAAIIGIIIFTIGFFGFGAYMVSYLNYLGELIVLMLFGMRRFSVDAYLFGPLSKFRQYWERYEITIVRIFYGAALAYAAIAVKFLHPELTLKVVTDWHLTQFHWLFPSDPLLVVLGGGLAELTIGIFIILGFELRLTVLISLFYITLSLFYFRELVWPHLLLYGISLNLLVQPEVLTLDHFIFARHRQFMAWWRRVFQPHKLWTKSILREEDVVLGRNNSQGNPS